LLERASCVFRALLKAMPQVTDKLLIDTRLPMFYEQVERIWQIVQAKFPEFIEGWRRCRAGRRRILGRRLGGLPHRGRPEGESRPGQEMARNERSEDPHRRSLEDERSAATLPLRTNPATYSRKTLSKCHSSAAWLGLLAAARRSWASSRLSYS